MPKRTSARAPQSAADLAVARVRIVALGASVGGLLAFSRLIGRLTDDTGMAFVVLQHLDPRRTSQLSHILSTRCALPVHTIASGMRVHPNALYVVPAGSGLTYAEGRFALRQLPAAPASPSLIDDFMTCLAGAQREAAVGVVLSGSGEDGVAGLRAIKAQGGTTFCQRPSSTGSQGMPVAAIDAGVVDHVLDPEQIADALTALGAGVKRGDVAPSGADPEASGFRELFAIIKASTGADVANLKEAMVRRRVARRMGLTGHAQLVQYVEFVKQTPDEQRALHVDLLIGVTGFFRDESLFEALARRVLPELVRRSRSQGSLRIWVAGCASGEEAYSFAICLLECFGDETPGKAVQIFATDIRPAAVERARLGVYPDAIRANVSSARLAKYFVEHQDGFQISPEVRKLCVFARHDVTRDPTFSKLDIVSCRNVLIYFDPAAREHALGKLHGALARDGLLVLGSSESVPANSLLFTRTDLGERIYRRLEPPGKHWSPAQVTAFANAPPYAIAQQAARTPIEDDVRVQADRILLSRFVPAALLIDGQQKVLQFRGNTGPFMGPLSGAASLSVLKLVDNGLLPALRYGIGAVQRTRKTYRRADLVVSLAGTPTTVTLEVVPLRTGGPGPCCCLIVLAADSERRSGARKSVIKGASARMLNQLRDELTTMRSHLQDAASDQENTNDSLRVALEELQSANEELQVTNAELETGKEELQSTNESLQAASSHVQVRNAELAQLIHDHVSIVQAAGVAAALFGRDLRLVRLTPHAAQVLGVPVRSLGQSAAELETGLQGVALGDFLGATLREGTPRKAEAQHGGTAYLLEVRLYRGSDGAIDGVVLTMTDVTASRALERELASARLRLAELEASALSQRKKPTRSRKQAL